MEQSLERIAQRLERLGEDVTAAGSADGAPELEVLDARIAEFEAQIEALQEEAKRAGEAIVDARAQLEETERRLAEARSEAQTLSGRRASLDALQESALGRTDEAAKNFLLERGLDRRPRLGERLHVLTGWEVAVEVVLEGALRAVVVEHLDGPAEAAQALEDAELTLFEAAHGTSGQALSDAAGQQHFRLRIGDDDLSSLLEGVWAAENPSRR